MSGKIKNSLFKTSIKLWVRLVFATVMCFIVWLSIDAVGLNVFGEVTGYEIYAYDENGENPQLLSSHTYAAGEDRTAEIKIKDNEVLIYLRAMSPAADVSIGVLTSIFTLLIYGLYPYIVLWDKGSHDENFVNIGKMDEDRYFGLKVGAIASVPSALLYLLLILGKFGVISGTVLNWHRLINAPFIPYIDAVEMGAKVATDLSVGSLLAVGATLLFVPFVSWIGYNLGYRHFSIREKIVYKNSASEID